MHAGFKWLREKQLLIANALLARLPSPKENVIFRSHNSLCSHSTNYQKQQSKLPG